MWRSYVGSGTLAGGGRIIRHPHFDATKGAGEGSDIAVFKVNSDSLRNGRDLKIYPACLPRKDRSRPTEGFHSGWSKVPPRDFIHPVSLQFYDV